MIEIADGLSIGTVIFCEDVRQEAGNKWSILGVLSADILVPSLPATVRLALYVEGEVANAYDGPLNLRLRLEDQELLVAQGKLNAQKGIIVLPVPQLIVSIPNAGMLRVDMGPGADQWSEVAAKQVREGTFKDGALVPPSAPKQPT